MPLLGSSWLPHNNSRHGSRIRLMGLVAPRCRLAIGLRPVPMASQRGRSPATNDDADEPLSAVPQIRQLVAARVFRYTRRAMTPGPGGGLRCS